MRENQTSELILPAIYTKRGFLTLLGGTIASVALANEVRPVAAQTITLPSVAETQQLSSTSKRVNILLLQNNSSKLVSVPAYIPRFNAQLSERDQFLTNKFKKQQGQNEFPWDSPCWGPEFEAAATLQSPRIDANDGCLIELDLYFANRKDELGELNSFPWQNAYDNKIRGVYEAVNSPPKPLWMGHCPEAAAMVTLCQKPAWETEKGRYMRETLLIAMMQGHYAEYITDPNDIPDLLRLGYGLIVNYPVGRAREAGEIWARLAFEAIQDRAKTYIRVKNYGGIFPGGTELLVPLEDLVNFPSTNVLATIPHHPLYERPRIWTGDFKDIPITGGYANPELAKRETIIQIEQVTLSRGRDLLYAA